MKGGTQYGSHTDEGGSPRRTVILQFFRPSEEGDGVLPRRLHVSPLLFFSLYLSVRSAYTGIGAHSAKGVNDEEAAETNEEEEEWPCRR